MIASRDPHLSPVTCPLFRAWLLAPDFWLLASAFWLLPSAFGLLPSVSPPSPSSAPPGIWPTAADRWHRQGSGPVVGRALPTTTARDSSSHALTSLSLPAPTFAATPPLPSPPAARTPATAPTSPPPGSTPPGITPGKDVSPWPHGIPSLGARASRPLSRNRAA